MALQIGSCPKGRCIRCRCSPGACWTSATSPRATTTSSASGKASSSRSWPIGSSELGVPILRGRDVVGFAQDDAGVDVELSDGASLRAGYLVGCDGGRSLIRKTAGIDFAGVDASTKLDDRGGRDGRGTRIRQLREGGGIGRAAGRDGSSGSCWPRTHSNSGQEPTLKDLSEALDRRRRDRLRSAQPELDLPVHRHVPAGRVVPQRARAPGRRRRPRASPHGGQGLNTGVQDAVNLGWKLAQVVNRTSPESLLDTYHAERHPVGARVLHNTMAQVALSTPDDRHQALRDTMAELLSMDEPRKHIAGMHSGLDIHYDLGEGHPLLGRRMPDLDLVTARPNARIRLASRCSARPPRLRRRRQPRQLAVVGSSVGDRRRPCRRMGAAGPRPGAFTHRGAGQTRRACRLGRRRHGRRTPRRTDQVGRTALTSPSSVTVSWRQNGVGPNTVVSRRAARDRDLGTTDPCACVPRLRCPGLRCRQEEQRP